jgi:hypothetical protein
MTYGSLTDILDVLVVLGTIVGGTLFVRSAYKVVTGSVEASIENAHRERKEWKLKHGLKNG